MQFKNQDLHLLDDALTKLKSGFDHFPDTLNEVNQQQIESILNEVAEKLHNNYPYFQDNYAGQMLKPPHAMARLAYMLALYINPNNHALDGSRASSPMEKECVSNIAKMYNWDQALGHLTSGGTMANLEALWVAGKYHPDKKIVASEMSHYTHERISEVLGLKFEKIRANNEGRMDIDHLEQQLKTNEIGTVVVTMGTTGAGVLDPLTEIIKLKERYNFRIHIDSAYGGYFILANALHADTCAEYQQMKNADSIVIDPHKHGLQPYGCGCILFKDREVGQFYKHDSPYTYFSSEELHLGEISLECSRAGASAVALWATMKLYPLSQKGAFAQELNKCHEAALKLHEYINQDDNFIPLFKPEFDIVVWAKKANTLSEMTVHSQRIFRRAAEKNIHLALIKYPTNLLPAHFEGIEKDADHVTCLRSCLMKASHLSFVEELWQSISEL